MHSLTIHYNWPPSCAFQISGENLTDQWFNRTGYAWGHWEEGQYDSIVSSSYICSLKENNSAVSSWTNPMGFFRIAFVWKLWNCFSNWKERIVSMCLANSIAMYSPHTAWDATLGGVNDWLANALPVKNIAPVKVRKMYTFLISGINGSKLLVYTSMN